MLVPRGNARSPSCVEPARFSGTALPEVLKNARGHAELVNPHREKPKEEEEEEEGIVSVLFRHCSFNRETPKRRCQSWETHTDPQGRWCT